MLASATSHVDQTTDGAPGKRKVGPAGWILRIAAVGYPVALLAVWLGLRFIGERWWVTTVALYLPRLELALPLPLLAAALARWGPRRLLLSQVAALVLLIPVLGWTWSFPRSPTPGAPQLRVLTFNINKAWFGMDGIVQVIQDAQADLVLLQEVESGDASRFAARLPGYQVRGQGQFVIASRFPIVEEVQRPGVRFEGMSYLPRFIRYRLKTPAGVIQVYNVHPPSPREGLDELRGEGLRHELESRRLIENQKAMRLLTTVTRVRLAVMRAVVQDASQSPDPVIIAGDTNLPDLSWAYAQTLGAFHDSFREAGRGFGYTFPANHHLAWMRIDRILSDGRFRFLRSRVIPGRASDHHALVADLEWR